MNNNKNNQSEKKNKKIQTEFLIILSILLALIIVFTVLLVQNKNIVGKAEQGTQENNPPPKAKATEDNIKKYGYDDLLRKYADELTPDADVQDMYALLKAVITQESGGNPTATSQIGAYGLGQIMRSSYPQFFGSSCDSTFRESDDTETQRQALRCQISAIVYALKDKFQIWKCTGSKEYACEQGFGGKCNNNNPCGFTGPAINEIYTGWRCAIRGYNTWSCCGCADREYVQNVLDYYNYYAGNSQTGNIISPTFSSNIIGTYSIMPNFKTEINYSLNDYYELLNFVNTTIVKCLDNPEECLNQEIELFNNNPDNSLTISRGCEEYPLYYDFIENYQDCLDFNESDCICKFYLNFSKASETQKILLSKEKYIELKEPDNDETRYMLDNIPTYRSKNPSDQEDVRDEFLYKIFYDNGNFEETELEGGIKRINNDNSILIYKKNSTTLVFIAEEDNKETCNIIKTKFRLCATTKNNIQHFERESKKLVFVNKPITIKFAVMLVDTIPPPISEGLNVEDQISTGQSVIVKWKENPAKDVNKYKIYYSEEDFLTTQKLDNVYTLELASPQPSQNSISDLDFSQATCEVEQDFFNRKVCTYTSSSGDNFKVYKSTLYYLSDTKEFFASIQIPDGINYYFAITAVDKYNNEIDILQPGKLAYNKNYNVGVSIDDTNPQTQSP